jgi:energy-coupling factor transport system ATP-binding protein
MWAMAGVGGLLAAIAAGAGVRRVAGVSVNLTALNEWALFLVITLLSLYAALLFTWTSPPADLPPFLQRLTGWTRRLRVPMAAPLAGIALALRLGPLLLAEARALLDVEQQRRRCRPTEPGGRRRVLVRAWDLLTLSCLLACRRGSEIADAITARGGLGAVAGADRRLRWCDLLALALVLAVLISGGRL